MKKTIPWLVAIGLGGSALGCSGEADTASQADTSGTGTVVARVQLTDTHYVEFLEYADGLVSVIEARPMDEKAAGGETVTFDPHQHSFVGLYQELLARSAYPDASDRQADVSRLERIDARFAALKEQASARPAAPADGVGVTQQLLSGRWGDYNTSPGDYNWFSQNFCFSYTDYCEVGWLGQHIVFDTHRSARVTLFNEDFVKDDATLRLAYDPCKGAPIWDFCTKPFKTVQTLAAPHRYVMWSGTWTSTTSDTIDWGVTGNGTHWGWGLIFDN